MKKRDEIKRRQARLRFGVVAASFLCALLVGAVLLLMDGKNPLETYYYLFIMPLTSARGFIKVLGNMTPLIFSGLAVALAFKCSVFNIGVEGQMYIGGLTAAVLGAVFKGLPFWIHIPICILGAMAAGAVVAWVPAILKVKLHVHEVISTIMLNYAVASLIAFVVANYFRYEGPHARTPDVLSSARFLQFQPPEILNSGLILALLLAVVLYFVFQKTPFGWKIGAAGKNLQAAKYNGMHSARLIVATMMLSGAIAALAGVERVMGAYGYMELNFTGSYGWDGITIAILAANHPLGVVLVAGLLGLMSYGGTVVNIQSGIPAEWVQVLTALIFIFTVMGTALVWIAEKRHDAVKPEGGAQV